MKVKLAIEWFLNPDHLPLIVGMEQNFFKKKGLELDLIVPTEHYDGLDERPKRCGVGSAGLPGDYVSGRGLLSRYGAVLRMGRAGPQLGWNFKPSSDVSFRPYGNP